MERRNPGPYLAPPMAETSRDECSGSMTYSRIFDKSAISDPFDIQAKLAPSIGC